MNFVPQLHSRKILLRALLAYAICNGLSLAYPNALFWDDWLFYIKTPIDFSEGGAREWCCWPRSSIESSLLGFWPGSFRLLTFFAFPVIAWMTYEAVKPLLGRGISEIELNYFTVLVLLLPLNSARIAAITFQWTLALLTFSVASLIWIRSRSIFPLVFGLLLFMFSFRMSSLLVFVLAPSAIAFVVERFRTYSSHPLSVMKLLLPITSALIYRLVISDNGSTAGYNEFQLTGIVKALLLLAALALFSFLLHVAQPRLSLNRRAGNQLVIGLLVLWLGAFPYMSVGHLSSIADWTSMFIPGVSDWNSRHQVLLSFGLAFSLIGFWNLLEGKALQILFPLIICISFFLTSLYSIEYFIDAKKQTAVMNVLEATLQSESDEFVYLIDDPSSARLNARGRTIREYEFDGLLKRALGDEAPRFLDEAYVQSTVCDSPSNIRVLRFVFSSSSFSRIQFLLGNSPKIEIEESSTMVCLR